MMHGWSPLYNSPRAARVATCLLFAGAFSVPQISAQTLPSPWIARDVGTPSVAGSTSHNAGTFTISAAGSDIWGTSDQFHFVYQQMTGDAEVIARVDSVTRAHTWSKGGVMIRSSLAAGAAHGFVFVSAANGVGFQRRRTDGTTTAHTNGPAAAPPRWVRVVRLGTTVTAFTSVDGSTWTRIGADTIALGSTTYVGLAATSHNTSALTTAVLSQVIARPLAVPSPQHTIDIGSPAIPGTVAASGGTYTINAAGVDIWNTADQFNFVYQQVAGDVDVSVRVRSVSQAHAWSKSGVMIRESLGAGSRHAFALVSAGGGFGFHRRIDPSGFTESSAGVAGTAPAWVRLVRTGSRIESFRSTDGLTWTSMGVDIVPMAETVYVGMATTSHNTSATTQAVVEGFRLASATQPAQNQPPTVSLTAPVSGTTYVAPASVALTATAADPDGTVSRVEFYTGTTLLGTDSTAPYSYAWASVPAGSYSLTAVAYDAAGASTTSPARTISVTGAVSTAVPSPWTARDIGAPALTGSATYSSGVFSVNAAGVDIWNTSDQFHFVYQAVSGDVEIIARLDSLTNVYEFTNAGVMVRGDLTASAVHGYTAVTAGRGVFFRRRGSSGGTTISTQGAITTAPHWVRLVRQGTLITSYSSADGSTWATVGSQTLPLGSTAYVGLAVSSHDVTARTAARFSNVRVTPATANQPPTVSLTAPASGAAYIAPASVALTASAADADGTVSRVEFYAGATLIATDTTAPYGYTWLSVPAGTYSLTAVAYDNLGARVTSAARSITVSGSTTTTPPTAVVFQASVDHATVTAYRLDVFASGANPSTATPVATSDLATPAPDVTGTITVNRATFFSNLAAGTYQATVSAIASGGSSRSTAVTFTR